jgi:hypothetical protein
VLSTNTTKKTPFISKPSQAQKGNYFRIARVARQLLRATRPCLSASSAPLPTAKIVSKSLDSFLSTTTSKAKVSAPAKRIKKDFGVNAASYVTGNFS